MRLPRGLVVSALGLLMSIGLCAEQPISVVNSTATPPAPKAPDYGPNYHSNVRVSAMEFSTLTGDPFKWFGGPGGVSRYPSTVGPLEANFQIPGGSVIKRVELDYCDNNPSSPMYLKFVQCDNQGQSCTDLLSTPLVSTGNGCSFVADSTLNITVNNYAYIYTLEVQFPVVDGTATLGGVIVSYDLQVSPAPLVPTFGDVPTGDPGFQYIEALVSSGITAGCAGGNYCPDAPLTRRQMAVFLSKALGLNWHPY